MLSSIVKVYFAIALLTVVGTSRVRTQDEWSWPEKPKNLQVLPKEWPGSRLRPVMIGFVRALGVGCSYCHVGQAGKPLSTFDFPSDSNPNKGRAREMLRMLDDINDHLLKIEPSGDRRVNMWCQTCHRGRPRPMTLEEELTEIYRTKGLDSAIQHYAELKTRYYGRGAYDFGERALNSFGYELLGSDEVAGAIRVFTLNADQFPASPNVWDSLAEAYMKDGNFTMAKRYYEKVLTIDPKSGNARTMLKKIKSNSEN